MSSKEEIAVLIPCYNEAAAIAKVVADFQKYLPKATIYVFDNNSTDETIDVAKKAGALVFKEPQQGKGCVVRRMFADVEADIYVMVDGDDTYDAASVNKLIDYFKTENLDMVVGIREDTSKEAYRNGHRWGNRLFNKILSLIFGSSFKDIFSGYRVFSRRYVKSFPALTAGFDIETELSVHSLELNIPTGELPTPYYERGEGSDSKLRTYHDGFLILWRMFVLFKEVRPLPFFSIIFVLLALLSLVLGYPVISEYFETGLVPRIPTALLSTGVMISALLSLFAGIILDSVSRGRKEVKRLNYLSLPLSSNKVK